MTATEPRRRWYLPTLWTTMVVAAVMYLWNLGESEWANSFYAAAVQAGSTSWKALLFGCSDMGCSITVDKPPASLWIMSLSGQIFGFSSWSMLIPEALLGAGTVGLVFAAVARWYGSWAGLIAGAALLATPVAALMFRFNNPDALLTFLLALSAYATVRATTTANRWWLMLAGSAIGFGFLTKMIQAFLILPALAIVYLVAAPAGWRRRIGDVLLAAGSLIVSAGWYIAVVELVPASDRPYIGGSTDNSLLQLALGYNGLNRITGDAAGSMGAGGGMGGGYAGWTRLFGTDMGGQIAWLLPAALISLVAGLAITARRPRTDRTRAGFVLWGGWLSVTGLVFSLMQGIIHAYYTVALAPAIAAMVGAGAVTIWRRREQWWAPLVAAGMVAGSVITAWRLLDRSVDWNSWLIPLILGLGTIAVAALVALPALPTKAIRPVAALAVVVCLLAPTAYTLATVSQPHSGSIPSAGPAVSRTGAPGPAMAGPGGAAPGGAAPDGVAPGGAPAGGGGQGSEGQGGGGPGGGGLGGFLDASRASEALVALLQADRSYTWAAATIGSNAAAGLQLSSGCSVMPIGGFNGGDNAPTLAQFKAWVAAGKIHYYVSSSGGGMQAIGGSDAPSQIQSWVERTFTSQTVDGTTVYDLSS